MKCINCHKEHHEKFCPNCGEHAKVKPISFASVFESAFSTISNMDKGFLFNLKNLTINPQKTITNYVFGKRKGIYNPISYLIITISIYLIVDSLIVFEKKTGSINSEIYSVGYEAGKFMTMYLKYFWILAIFWLSSSTKLIFNKYNFAEHLAINSFIIGHATLAALIGLTFFKWLLIFNPIVYLVILLMVFQVFKKGEHSANAFFKALVCVVLFFIQLILIVAAIGMIRSYLL